MKRCRLGFFAIFFVAVIILAAGVAVYAGGPSEEEAQALGQNEFYNSSLSGTGSVEYYAFTPETSETMVFDVNVLEGADIAKVSVYSNDLSTTFVDEDQTGAVSAVVTPTVGATYYIKVESLQEDVFDYMGIVFQDNVGDDSASAMDLEPYNEFFAYLNEEGSSGDVDVFKYTTRAALSFYVEVHIFNEFQGEDPPSPWTAEIEVYEDANLSGTPVYSSGVVSDQPKVLISNTAPEQDYYIKVSNGSVHGIPYQICVYQDWIGDDAGSAQETYPDDVWINGFQSVSDEDVFVFTAEDPEELTFEFEVYEESGDEIDPTRSAYMEIYLGDMSGSPDYSSGLVTSAGSSAQKTYTPSKGDVYYIRLYGASNDMTQYGFMSRQDIVRDSGANAWEIGAYEEFFTKLSTRGAVVDVDVFSYTTQAPYPFYLNVHVFNEWQGDDPEETWSVQVEVYDNEDLTGTPLYSGSDLSDLWVQKIDNEAESQTYYIVISNGSADWIPYQISIFQDWIGDDEGSASELYPGNIWWNTFQSTSDVDVIVCRAENTAELSFDFEVFEESGDEENPTRSAYMEIYLGDMSGSPDYSSGLVSSAGSSVQKTYQPSEGDVYYIKLYGASHDMTQYKFSCMQDIAGDDVAGALEIYPYDTRNTCLEFAGSSGDVDVFKYTSQMPNPFYLTVHACNEYQGDEPEETWTLQVEVYEGDMSGAPIYTSGETDDVRLIGIDNTAEGQDYYIKVSNGSVDALPYYIQLFQDWVGGDADSAQEVRGGDRCGNDLEVMSDVDVFKFTADNTADLSFSLEVFEDEGDQENPVRTATMNIYLDDMTGDPDYSFADVTSAEQAFTPSEGDVYYIELLGGSNDMVIYVLNINQDIVGDDAAGAADLECYNEFNTVLDYDGDVDVFKYTSQAPYPFYLNLHVYNEWQGDEPSETWEVQVDVYEDDNLSGTPIFSSGSISDLESVKIENLAQDDDYYIVISNGSADWVPYSICIFQDWIGDEESSAQEIYPGDKYDNGLQGLFDVDVYKVTAQNTSDITFVMGVYDEPGDEENPYRAASMSIYLDDMSGSPDYTVEDTAAAEHTYSPSEGDVFYVAIYNPSHMMTQYSLSVLQDTVGDDMENARWLGNPEWIESNLDSAGDIDYFVFSAEMDADVYFNIEFYDEQQGEVTITGPSSIVYDTDGTPVTHMAESDSATQGDTYYVKIFSGSQDVVRYRLIVSQDVAGSTTGTAYELHPSEGRFTFLETVSDVDVYRYDTTDETPITFTVNSQQVPDRTLDVTIQEAGESPFVDESDTFGVEETITPSSASVTYYITVSGSYAMTPYSISIAQDRIGDTQAEAKTMNNGDIYYTLLENMSDSDWFQYESMGTSPIDFFFEVQDEQTASIMIADSSMTLLEMSETRGETLHIDAPAEGDMYYICVSSGSRDFTPYMVGASQDMVGDTTEDAMGVNAGEPFFTYLETTDDVDVFEYTVSELPEGATEATVAFGVNVHDGKTADVEVTSVNGTATINPSGVQEGIENVEIVATVTSVPITFYLEVSGGTENLVPFEVWVYDSRFDPPELSVGEVVYNSLQNPGDSQVYSFTPDASGGYYFNAIRLDYGNALVKFILFEDGVEEPLAESEKVPIPNKPGYSYGHDGLWYTLEAGKKYYYEVYTEETDIYHGYGEYAVALSTYNPNTELTFTDSGLISFFNNDWYIPDSGTGSMQVTLGVMLMMDSIQVEGLADITGMEYAKYIRVLEIGESPAFSSIVGLDNDAFPYLFHMSIDGSSVSEWPADMSAWRDVGVIGIKNSHLLELPNLVDLGMSHLSSVDITGNYIDFSSGSESCNNIANLNTAGVWIDGVFNQKQADTVDLAFSPEVPKVAEDMTLTATSFGDGVDITVNSEYQFAYSQDGENWVDITEDWGENEVTGVYVNEVGQWWFKATGRLKGTDEEGTTTVEEITVGDLDPISKGRASITGVSKENVEKEEAFDIDIQLDLTGLERYMMEYRLVQSTNQSTWEEVTSWAEISGDEVVTDTLGVSAPDVTQDTTYYYALELRPKNASSPDYLDRSDSQVVAVYTVMPLESVSLIVGDGSADQVAPVLLAPEAENRAGYSEIPEYKYYYRLEGSTRWTVVASAYSTDDYEFTPGTEGSYYFKVESRSVGRTTVDAEYETVTAVNIFTSALPAEGLTLAITDGETQFLSTETVPLEITAIGNGEDDMEYLVEFSTNGKTYKPLIKGEAWHAFVPTSGDTMLVDQTLPAIKKDTLLYIRASVRSAGRTTTDAYDVTTISAYMVMPLASVTLDSVGDTTAGQAVTEAGITLTATAANKAGYAETPTYRFAYRMEGSAKWAYIGKAFSEDNTIRFVPKTEGTYYFKVEAQSLGRKTKAGDVWDYDYTAYALSNTAEPVKGIYSLTSDEKDYINGETVTLTMDITQNTAGDDVEYQLLYSTNGKSFKPFSKEYAPLAVTAGKAEIEAPALPLVKKDTIYYLKVQVRTIGRTEKEPDAFAMTQVEFKTAHPVEAGEVAVIGVGNDAAEQSVDAEGITLTATERANTEYRFAYQKLGDTKWSYVSSKWSTERTITFVPKTDGRYQFCVEARSLTRTTTDTTSAATGYYGLYYLSLGAESASVAVNGSTEFVNDLEGIDVPVVYSVEGNGTDTYDLRALYSTNGKSYKELYYVEGMGPEAITDASIIITLPAVKKDTHYWLKFEAKTNGHATADVFDTAEVDVYMVEPLTSMDSFVSDADSGLAVLGAVDDVLTLTATANDDAAYKFYYRTVGTDKWSSISSKYVVENQAYFRPKTEGAYEFKAEATALGRKAKTADVSAELSEPIDIWFTAEPAHWISLGINDDDADYIIGLDSEMSLEMEADGTDAGMEYQIVYSNNGGKSYKPLSAWQPLTATSTFDDVASCALPIAKKDTLYLIKAQVRSTGRTTADAESEAEEIWLLSQEREVDADLIIPGETHEYTETITANIAISEPASGEVEYQLQYSTDNKKWNDLSAHDWSVYDDGGTGSINVELDLAELNGDMTAYIKLNARMKNSTKIEDSDVDRFDIYSIGPVSSVDMGVLDTDENYALIEASAVSSFAHTAEYRYSYALAGQSKMTWIPFTSWTVSDEVTFTPSLSGDYLFMVEARSKGRLTVDATAEATNEDSGYYLKSIEDMLLPEPVPEPSAAPTPSEAPTVIPSAVPSEAPSTEPSTEPSASPSATPAPKLISSLEYATSYVLGENADLDSYTEQEVALEDILSVLADEDAPMILVQLGEETFAVITGYEADEDSNLKRLTLTDQMGETILGGTEGILRAWVYTSAEPEVSEAPSETPSGEPSIEPAPESEASEAPAASESPSAQPSETPAA